MLGPHWRLAAGWCGFLGRCIEQEHLPRAPGVGFTDNSLFKNVPLLGCRENKRCCWMFLHCLSFARLGLRGGRLARNKEN